MKNHAVELAWTDSAAPPECTAANRLRKLGFKLNFLGRERNLAHGVAERVSVRDVLDNDDIAQGFVQRLCGFAEHLVPVCLSPVELYNATAAVSSWQGFCQLIRDAGAARGFDLGGIGFCIHSHQLPLDDYCDIADAALGRGPRYVFLDSLQMQSHSNARVEAWTESNWAGLWHRRHAKRPLLPVYGGFVRSACPLLADEVAVSVLSATGLLAPFHSAWLPVGLDLGAFADRAGRLDEGRLASAVQCAVVLADELLDELGWGSPLQNEDAVRNRRLAFLLGGIGDLVVRRGENPAELACLRKLGDTIGLVRREFDKASADLALRSGEVPALSSACPPGDWFDGSHSEVWKTRFDAACRKAAVRHRNILAISPYAVLPSGPRCEPAFADLLPLLSYAEAWSFAGAPRFAGWNVTQFKHFHKRARAVIQGSQASSLVAAGV